MVGLDFVKKAFRNGFAVFVIGASILSFQSCRVDKSTSSSGDTPPGESPDLGLTAFRVHVQAEDASYSLHASKNGDGKTPCVPSANDRDITCVIDMEELDLFQRGLTINIDVPGVSSSSNFQCSYLIEHPYFYRVTPLSLLTPTAVFLAENEDGLLDPADPEGANFSFGGSADIYYVFGGVAFSHEDLYGAPATGSDDLRCPWDYTKVGAIYEGQNCCVGIYTQYKATFPEGQIQRETTSQSWGGFYDKCLAGAGVVDWEPRSDGVYQGVPVPFIWNVPTGGLRQDFKITAPTDVAYEHQIHATNYFSGQMPEPLQDGNPYYLYGCLDSNHEYLYRIKVQIREWNKAGELDKLLAGLTANSNSTGCEETPFGMMPINDHSDWGDYQNALNPGLSLEIFGFSLAEGDESPILQILNASGRSYTASSRFLTSNQGGWGIDFCP